ncbi:trypsin-like serine peptidase [Pseudonocardia phyllosphaerae]|uniref:trypsin-like serine peptidase n=1 Tax=Pseudonocardia phyllosphaerae TaxID=3390502 RepID=UPI00397E1566
MALDRWRGGRVRPAAVLLPALVVTAVLVAANVPAARDDPGTPWPATGALFEGPDGPPGTHFCTGSVVDSPAGNLVVTAAHCASEGDGAAPSTDISFAPGYHDGVAPSGTWRVTSVLLDPAWANGADPDHDVAFLQVERDDGTPVQEVTGADHLVFGPAPTGTSVTAVGYPVGAERPAAVTGRVDELSPTQLRLDVPGLPDGTSGGPWLAGPHGTDLVGVTGGFEEGGSTADTSFAAVLSDDVRALYARATVTPAS